MKYSKNRSGRKDRKKGEGKGEIEGGDNKREWSEDE